MDGSMEPSGAGSKAEKHKGILSHLLRFISNKPMPKATTDGSTRQKLNNGNPPMAKMLLIASENRGGFPNSKAKVPSKETIMSPKGGDSAGRCQPSVVARLMGLESMPPSPVQCRRRKENEVNRICASPKTFPLGQRQPSTEHSASYEPSFIKGKENKCYNRKQAITHERPRRRKTKEVPTESQASSRVVGPFSSQRRKIHGILDDGNANIIPSSKVPSMSKDERYPESSFLSLSKDHIDFVSPIKRHSEVRRKSILAEVSSQVLERKLEVQFGYKNPRFIKSPIVRALQRDINYQGKSSKEVAHHNRSFLAKRRDVGNQQEQCYYYKPSDSHTIGRGFNDWQSSSRSSARKQDVVNSRKDRNGWNGQTCSKTEYNSEIFESKKRHQSRSGLGKRKEKPTSLPFSSTHEVSRATKQDKFPNDKTVKAQIRTQRSGNNLKRDNSRTRQMHDDWKPPSLEDFTMRKDKPRRVFNGASESNPQVAWGNLSLQSSDEDESKPKGTNFLERKRNPSLMQTLPKRRAAFEDLESEDEKEAPLGSEVLLKFSRNCVNNGYPSGEGLMSNGRGNETDISTQCSDAVVTPPLSIISEAILENWENIPTIWGIDNKDSELVPTVSSRSSGTESSSERSYGSCESDDFKEVDLKKFPRIENENKMKAATILQELLAALNPSREEQDSTESGHRELEEVEPDCFEEGGECKSRSSIGHEEEHAESTALISQSSSHDESPLKLSILLDKVAAAELKIRNEREYIQTITSLFEKGGSLNCWGLELTDDFSQMESQHGVFEGDLDPQRQGSKLMFDCVKEALSEELCLENNGNVVWMRGPMVLKQGNCLVEKIGKIISDWRGTPGCVYLDDIVEKERGLSRKWEGFDSEVAEVGLEIEHELFGGLIDELLEEFAQ